MKCPDIISVLIVKIISGLFFKKGKNAFHMYCALKQISDILHSHEKIAFLSPEVAEA
jgi:hypothetical protein